MRQLLRPCLLALTAWAALPAGCGGDDDGRAKSATGRATTTATATATATPAVTTTATPDPLAGAGTDPVSVQATNTETALLGDVRVAAHQGYDRIVFEFGKALPGYDVRYVTTLVTEDGSGRPVRLDGTAVLRIRMENALDADLSRPSAPLTYSGPTRFSPRDTIEVVELARAGGFEGVLTWAAGLRDRAPFKVATLDDPARLVIDVRFP